MTFTSATFSKTLLADVVLIGSTPHGAREARNGGKFDALSRIYKTKEFGNVRLVENDYVAGGGAALFYTEDLNADVNGVPARILRALQARSPLRDNAALGDAKSNTR